MMLKKKRFTRYIIVMVAVLVMVLGIPYSGALPAEKVLAAVKPEFGTVEVYDWVRVYSANDIPQKNIHGMIVWDAELVSPSERV